MVRRLVTPRWLGAVLLAALFAVACYHLGWWQYDRHVAKLERNDRLDAFYRADPVPLRSVLTPAGVDPGREWSRAVVRGRYGPGPVFVRGRTLNGKPGLELLWALMPDDGGPALVVDRGWVPVAAEGAAVLPPAPPAPTGPVQVVGWVRRSEASRGHNLPAGQLASVNVAEAGRELGLGVLPAYLQLESERLADGSSPPRPEPLGEPERSLGTHLAYAYQWWLTMALGFWLVWFGIRREVRAEAPGRHPPKAGTVRIWDEDDD
ncbi:MAG: SURF1 family cytochrome oxidase biogenesis protein [Dermatophilaceae bacterium]